MKNEYEFYEQLLFGYVSYIKDFNTYLTKEYGLTDIPYNVAGKAFPKIGSVVINNVKVDYRWHGRGCTLFWGKLEIFFNVDAPSVNQIIITPGGMYCYLQTKLSDAEKENYLGRSDEMLEQFEKHGAFVKRRPGGPGTFQVNEAWYSEYATGMGKDLRNLGE